MPIKIDIFDENNKPTGRTATYDEIRSQGLWQRGVHVVLYTSDGRILMQKRSAQLEYHPNEIEVSVGGGVDAGEEPLQAAVREVREELGLRIDPDELQYIGLKKFNHRYKSGGRTRYMRTHLYAYKALVTDEKLSGVHLAQNEVTDVFMLTRRQLLRALRVHRIRRFWRVVPQYAYWRYLVKSIK